LKSLPDVVNANGIDALLIDSIQFYVELAAMQLGVPYLHVAAGVHFDYSGHTPLRLYGRPHQTTTEAFARNREVVAKFVNILNSANAGIKAYAEKAGLDIDWEDPASTLSPLASISQVPEGLDYEGSHRSQFHLTGPFHDGRYRTNRSLSSL
jgi:zeaxanthin glucosyltransferase